MARTTIATPGFLDRLGDRVIVTDRTGGDLEVLRLRPELTAEGEFENGLKARAEQLAGFQHRAAARVRGISRLPGADGRLAVVSDAAKGWRLSEVLQAAEHEGRLIHTSTVLFLVRQVASVVAALQACGPEIAHGALGPERIVISPAGRVLVVEYVLGAALEYLPALPADRLWKEYRLAVPPDAAERRFGQQTDVLQLGMVALSLVHNRLLKRDEYPARLPELIDSATESLVTGARQPLGRVLRDWLAGALGLVPGVPRWTMEEAQRGLDWIVSTEGGYFSTPVGLEPLLQSVERFFTVPPASDDVQPASATAAPAPPAAATTTRIRPATEADPDPVPAVEAREDVAPPPPTLTLVKPSDAPLALRPASELLARTVVGEDGRLQSDDEETLSEPLIVTTSPLAEFAGEREADDASASPAPVPETGAGRVSLWPLPTRTLAPTEATEAAEGPRDVAPLADMLGAEWPSGRRRSGWNGEAWLSRSVDRQSSGARAAVSSSAHTVRLSASGGAATAAALRPREEQLPAEPALTHDAPPATESKEHVPEVVQPRQQAASGANPVARSGGHAAADSGAHRAAARTPLPGASATRSLFGEHDHASEGAVQVEPPRRARGRALLWPAAAALLIVCGGGFAAWKMLQPSDAPRPATVASPATTRPQPRPEARTPVPSPAAETKAAPAAAAPAAPSGVPADPKPASGSLQLVAPIVVSVSEKGEALGTSAAPIALAAGSHVLDLANDEVGYHATRAVEVRAGRLTKTALAMPNGSVNINATPWAEVLVDGQRVGETPLGNVQLTVGPHEVKFRHPQLGEQVRTVVITTGSPGRLSVDMKQ